MYISPSSSSIAIAVILQQPMLDLLREIHLESDLLPTPYKILHLTLSKDVLQTQIVARKNSVSTLHSIIQAGISINNHPGGNKADTFGSLKNGRMCLPRTNSFGGALYIGAHPILIANTTKLECFFPNSETANCDISLVDGFSLPLICNMGSQSMGGDIDLWNTGTRCENESNKHLGIYTNTRKINAEANVPDFFQPATRDGNSYCIWTKCTQNPFFSIHNELKCHVGSTKLSPASP